MTPAQPERAISKTLAPKDIPFRRSVREIALSAVTERVIWIGFDNQAKYSTRSSFRSLEAKLIAELFRPLLCFKAVMFVMEQEKTTLYIVVHYGLGAVYALAATPGKRPMWVNPDAWSETILRHYQDWDW